MKNKKAIKELFKIITKLGNQTSIVLELSSIVFNKYIYEIEDIETPITKKYSKMKWDIKKLKTVEGMVEIINDSLIEKNYILELTLEELRKKMPKTYNSVEE